MITHHSRGTLLTLTDYAIENRCGALVGHHLSFNADALTLSKNDTIMVLGCSLNFTVRILTRGVVAWIHAEVLDDERLFTVVC
jgi:hypothetical protein